MRSGEKDYYEIMRKTYFVLCESCYWCASLLGTVKRTIKCPTCDDYGRIEFIMIYNARLH
jgi:hypothetical protein